MIGVIVEEKDAQTAEEFFQLFKTPWEFAIREKYYDVILATTDFTAEIHTSLLIIYGRTTRIIDGSLSIMIQENPAPRILSFEGMPIPLYHLSANLLSPHSSLAFYQDSNDVAIIKVHELNRTTIRIGFDLLDEINYLIVHGQPVHMSFYPTLDAHIHILRRFISSEKIPFIEIPPTPLGYSFIAALTHDVDFAGIRKHKGDHTMWGFLARATFGSIRRLMSSRLTIKETVQNWLAALRLPLVMGGWAKDFWLRFDDYLQIESSYKSTFFIIPFKNRAGIGLGYPHAKRRATKYDVDDIPKIIRQLHISKKEVALHGIDAWHDLASAEIERKRIESSSAISPKGVRMHWLYFTKESPAVLDQAGFEYDSSWGYNETIGFRAGTLQVFQPLGCLKLLELPLHIQDVAMFYPNYEDWKPSVAWSRCIDMLNYAEKFGGVITLLWHERSLSPERQWRRFYKQLLEEFQRRKAWIDSASEIVTWFRNRRGIVFAEIESEGPGIRVKLLGSGFNALPSFAVLWHTSDGPQILDAIYSEDNAALFASPSKKKSEVKAVS